MFSFSDQIVIEIKIFERFVYIYVYVKMIWTNIHLHFLKKLVKKIVLFCPNGLWEKVLKMAYKRSIILKYIFLNEGMTFNLNKLGPVVKKLKLGKVYNNNINDKDKERTNFEKFYYNMQQKFKM